MRFVEKDGMLYPAPMNDDASNTGWIDAIDPKNGKVETIYRDCDDAPLMAPNDIAFDSNGGFWFTDHGKMRRSTIDRGAVYYAAADGSAIRRVIAPLDSPNGIGLSCTLVHGVGNAQAQAWSGGRARCEGDRTVQPHFECFE